MIPLTSTALANAILSAAAQNADPALSYLSRDYPDGELALVERLRSLSAAYARTGRLSSWDDIFECLLHRLQRISPSTSSSQAREYLEKSLRLWLIHLNRYDGMSLTALASTLTENYAYWIIDRHSPLWPKQLYDLYLIESKPTCPPLCLWGVGDPAALLSCDEPFGIIGSRSVNSYGRQVAFDCAKDAALQGHLIISGGALGGDAAAHWGALAAADLTDAPGKTIAIMAGGLKHSGPTQNTTLFQRMTAAGGALISELPPQTVPESFRFLDRNRLIAALASTLIISQAQMKSGALNTATWAAYMNRLVLAAPGNINTPYNAGCNHLIFEAKATILPTCVNLENVTQHYAHEPQIVELEATETKDTADSHTDADVSSTLNSISASTDVKPTHPTDTDQAVLF